MWCFELVSGSVRQLVIGLRDSFRPVVAEFLVTALHVTCGAAGQLGLIKDCHVTLLSHSSSGMRLRSTHTNWNDCREKSSKSCSYHTLGLKSQLCDRIGLRTKCSLETISKCHSTYRSQISTMHLNPIETVKSFIPSSRRKDLRNGFAIYHL